jgi:hypothetical protein
LSGKGCSSVATAVTIVSFFNRDKWSSNRSSALVSLPTCHLEISPEAAKRVMREDRDALKKVAE